MENSLCGVILTIIAPFGVLGLASGIRKLGVSAEASRKFVHILLSNWIILALAVYSNAWACAAPACFVVLNYISYRKGIFSAIERDEDNTLGTVWYAVSLFLLCFAGYSVNMPWIAACGMLAMGYGDGLGALVGKRWGKSYFPGVHSKKSLEGTFTVMLFAGVAVGVSCAIYASDFGQYFWLQAALACAVPAAALELSSPSGIDNLTLPLGVGMIVYLLTQYPSVWQIFVCLSISLFILIVAYGLRSITFSALQVAALLGVTLFVFGGWISFGALILFFVLGSTVSIIGKNKKSSATALHERKGARTIAQVLANGLSPLIFSALYYITGSESFLLAVIASLASAAADTFSSEIGMLSKKDPISILTGKRVQRGMSGGVTPLGFLGALLGAFMISILAVPEFGISGMLVSVLAGVADSILDSVLGEAFQAKYELPGTAKGASSKLTERKYLNDTPLKQVKGISWIDNDVVNFLSPFICGWFAVVINCIL